MKTGKFYQKNNKKINLLLNQEWKGFYVDIKDIMAL